jgi:RimJ/RimL family protein N-acetyltransferase
MASSITKSEAISLSDSTKPTSIALLVPILTLSKSIIRPYHPSDAPSLAAAANNLAVGLFLRNCFPNPYTLADAEWWISHCESSKPVYNWALVHPTTGEIMGGIGLRPGQDVHCRSAELGYWLAEGNWGKGIMSEAAGLFVSWCFEHFEDLVRIHADVFDGNEGSKRVLEKSGFLFEGRIRRAIWKNGVLRDALVHSVIREDWERERETRKEIENI